MKLGIDIGGTFTDFVLFDPDSGKLSFVKTLTTYPDPTEGIFNGIDELKEKFGIDVKQIDQIIHGTTLVTNAIIERKGARTAFVSTKGFEDVLEIGRELRYDIYDLFLNMPEPLVPRNLRIGLEERINNRGETLTELNLGDLASVSDLILEKDIQSVGVCLLNSFANTKHEEDVKEYLNKKHPELFVSLSSEVMPEIREYERSSATAMNAYVQPITHKYLNDFKRKLGESGFEGKILIMISSGRLTTLEQASNEPIQLLESGPAGGAMAGVFFGNQLKEENLLCFDMGGTTAKAAIIFKGKPEISNQFEAARVKRFRKGSGLPVRIPVIDLIEIGAGGGSIAQLDKLKLVQVGPESASSKPGPASYNLGGSHATVTDADLILGYLNPNYFLGGEMSLNVEAAQKVLQKELADPLQISVEEAAFGIHKIVNENMANAARVHILEKGMDPRHFNMIAFGGAGPVHAFGVARLLNVKRLIIPVGAGVTSALGFLVSPVAYEKIHSHIELLSKIDWDECNAFLAEMENEGDQFLQNADIDGKETRLERVVDMRYKGQGHEISIELPEGKLSEDSVALIKSRFIEEYQFRYNRSIEGVEMEFVTWRVVVKGPKPSIKVENNLAGMNGERKEVKKRSVYFQETGFVPCPVYSRYHLEERMLLDGPAIIEEKESTTVIGPNSKFQIDQNRNIIIDLL